MKKFVMFAESNVYMKYLTRTVVANSIEEAATKLPRTFKLIDWEEK